MDKRDLLIAMLEDMEGAKANCGKYGGVRDCRAWTERNLRCSDCPVEVWLSSTYEALTEDQQVEGKTRFWLYLFVWIILLNTCETNDRITRFEQTWDQRLAEGLFAEDEQ